MRLTPRMVARRGHPKKMEWAVSAEDKVIRKDFCTSHHITPQWVCAHTLSLLTLTMATDSRC